MNHTLVLKSSDRKLTLAGARVVVKKGPDKGKAVPIDRDEIVIGSALSSTLVLTDPTVSRAHAVIHLAPPELVIEDLDSTNGVRVNGARVARAYLEPKDRLLLGDTELRVERTDGVVELALSLDDRFGELIGHSVAARRLFAQLETIAPTEMGVLLLGETGVGKEAVAHAIHAASPRSAGPFVVVDCGAIAAGLIDSELFGHEKGAFTGAHSRRHGAFVDANGGTIFLDEIGELPRELQPRLLRAIEAREVRPVGANGYVPVDVRIIAATNRDLNVDVNRGLFREDLFYRLNGCPLRIPPLRERPEDIPLLAEYFRRELSGGAPGALPPALMQELIAHPWLGNVRELRNRVERALLLGPESSDENTEPSFREAKARVVAAFEQEYFRGLLERTKGNVSEAARIAKMERSHLSRILSGRPRR